MRTLARLIGGLLAYLMFAFAAGYVYVRWFGGTA